MKSSIVKTGLALAFTLLIAGLAAGCPSQTLPPRITAAQNALLDKTRIDLTVGVEDYQFTNYSDALVEALGDTHLFARVDHVENFATPPDLIARVSERICGTATIPIWTGLSFGIIPTTVNEAWGYSFSLSRPGSATPRLPIRFVYSGPTTLGWWAIVRNLSPSRTARDVYHHPRFIEAFAWEIAEKQAAIESLKGK